MSYTALYRKFRPSDFSDVKGQEHIITTLQNQIKAERIGHAYLFCGTRGTGKTTIAKIFAKAVNCEHSIHGGPCNECETCRAIQAGASMNVMEIDAASNNGVENIREIREEVAYSPASGKYKVYIIDEVHMLSIGAFNALLKTLEEPPSYVIFILATTEVHKIPITILSRCQKYDFRRISMDTISNRLLELMEKENIEVEERALRYIAKAADGSMRDALSLLDQCIAFYLGQKLTYENVLDVLGAVDTEVFSKLLRSILDHDVSACIRQLEEIVIQGRELSQFVIDITWYLRNLLLVKTSAHMEEALDVSKEGLERLKEESAMLPFEDMIRYIRIFSELSNQIRYSGQKRVLIEIALIKLCKPEMETDVTSLQSRIEQLEKRLEQGIMVSAPQTNSPNPIPTVVANSVKKPTVSLPKAIPEDIKEVVKSWKTIINHTTGLIKPYLRSAKLSIGNENQLIVVLEDSMAYDIVNTPSHKKEVEDTISSNIGKTVALEIRKVEENRSFEETYVNLEDVIRMDIVIED